MNADEPALISLPTGTGKTGVALAAPFLLPSAPKSTLVLVPSKALREQTVRQFANLEILQHIGAIESRSERPLLRVHEVTGHSTDWDDVEADVTVAIPQSISPASSASVSVPPDDMFDLVIVDEAHHVPSKTWSAVLEYLNYRYAVLLTATPFRLDGRPLPGARVFHYPLRRALDEGFYKPVTPMIVARPEPFSNEAKDAAICEATVDLAMRPEHASSALLVRAATVDRATELAVRYSEAGIETEVLTQRTTEADYQSITERLADGRLRAVAVVGMLGEGFDLPRLRLVAYHDKHKSMPATIQLIGRLARVSAEFPQDSVLITIDDTEVYPELRSTVKSLYDEDADWATILPGLVDAEVEAERRSQEFVESLHTSEGHVNPTSLKPMPTPTVFEVTETGWTPLEADGELPQGVRLGETLGGAQVIAAFRTDDGSMLVVVTRRTAVPKWSTDPSLESVEYGLSVVSYRESPQTDLPSLVFLDAADGNIRKALLDELALPDDSRPVEPQRVDGYLQSLPRVSVSSIGMRNLLAGNRGTTYRTRAGRSTDTDLQAADGAQSALGHVMLQVDAGSFGSTSVGAAFEKGKIWQRRYKSLVDYSSWVTEAAQLLWFPRTGPSQLIPQIARSSRLEEWPTSTPLAIEPHPSLASGGFQLFDASGKLLGGLEDFELHAGHDPTGTYQLPPATADHLPVVGVVTNRHAGTTVACWTGTLGLNGTVDSVGGSIRVRHGYQSPESIEEFLGHYSPIVYFASGHVVQGHELFDVRSNQKAWVTPTTVEAHDWTGVDISAETKAKAASNGAGISIHERVESILDQQPRQGKYRWLICNDGAGEIADHLLIEYTPGGPVRLDLWHSKYADGTPGLRVSDFQVVVAQAIRSRSHYNDPKLWATLRDRLTHRKSPKANLVAGSDSMGRLLVLLGEQQGGKDRRKRSWPATTPLVEGSIGIVQPGLSLAALQSPTSKQAPTASSLRELISVFESTMAATGRRARVIASK